MNSLRCFTAWNLKGNREEYVRRTSEPYIVPYVELIWNSLRWAYRFFIPSNENHPAKNYSQSSKMFEICKKKNEWCSILFFYIYKFPADFVQFKRIWLLKIVNSCIYFVSVALKRAEILCWYEQFVFDISVSNEDYENVSNVNERNFDDYYSRYFFKLLLCYFIPSRDLYPYSGQNRVPILYIDCIAINTCRVVNEVI